ncbi:KOW domain-containing RNA-binding protein [uncultured Clostridium sp.]|uniref:KOW domain-containing RNA-binding protein n=1 Tax=uncultured Clostridium sp. TaxID=59620 RepID=UPI0028EB2C10|nr:KOW domain-containing RNA-binding protein [uncultured Clostridium sp.]
MEDNDQIGKVVYSKAGRDKDKFFIVTGVLDEQYVSIADGSLRPIEKPKKKKIRHLVFTNTIADELKNLLLSGDKVSNSMIRKILQSHDMNKEV